MCEGKGEGEGKGREMMGKKRDSRKPRNFCGWLMLVFLVLPHSQSVYPTIRSFSSLVSDAKGITGA